MKKKVLKDINMNGGKMTALVGLGREIYIIKLKFYDPTSGQILIDGQSLKM